MNATRSSCHGVCILHNKQLFLLVDIQHTRYSHPPHPFELAYTYLDLPRIVSTLTSLLDCPLGLLS